MRKANFKTIYEIAEERNASLDAVAGTKRAKQAKDGRCTVRNYSYVLTGWFYNQRYEAARAAGRPFAIKVY